MRRFTLTRGSAAALLLIVGLAVSVRQAPAQILTVDSTADVAAADAVCTLREAVEEANRGSGVAVYTECGAPLIGGADTIMFDAAIAGSTIVVNSALRLDDDNATTLDGVGSSITLDGSAIVTLDGVIFVTSDNNAIRGLTITGGTYGVWLAAAADNNIVGGTAFNEGNTIRDTVQAGVFLNGGTNNSIGHNTIIENNLIGIWVANATDTIIRSNRIGLDASQASAGNDEGIFVNSDDVRITENVISGNTQDGVRIADAMNVNLRKNRIGMEFAGTLDRGNGSHGIHIYGTSDVTIGGVVSAGGNWISGNGGSGVFVNSASAVVLMRHNYIGTDLSGTAAIRNNDGGVNLFVVDDATLRNNLISGNGLHGVSLGTGSATLHQNRIGVTPGLAALPNEGGGVSTSDEMLLLENVIAFHSGPGDVGINVDAGGDLLSGSVFNCITSNDTGLEDNTSLDISIVNNWWGDASGPSDFGGGTGDALTVTDVFGITAYLPVQAIPTIPCP